MQNEVVYIYNSQPRIFHLPDTVRRHSGKLAGDDMTTAVVALGDGKQVMPSAPREKDGKQQPTAVDKKYWETLCAPNPQVRVWLKKGWLRLAEAHEATEDDIGDLSSFNLKTAQTIVSGESNAVILAAWLKAERRDEVKELITARMETVKAAAKLPPLGKK